MAEESEGEGNDEKKGLESRLMVWLQVVLTLGVHWQAQETLLASENRWKDGNQPPAIVVSFLLFRCF